MDRLNDYVNDMLTTIGECLDIELRIAASACDRYNVRTFKVGGLRFVRLGRFCMSFCMCRKRRPGL